MTSHFLSTVVARWRVLLAAVLISVLAGLLTVAVITPSEATREYQATAILLSTEVPEGDRAVTNLERFEVFLVAGEVPRRAAEATAYEGDPSRLADAITVETNREAGAVRINAQTSDPEDAVAIASAFSTALIDVLLERQTALRNSQLTAVSAEVEELGTQINDLNSRISASGAGEGSLIVAERDAKIRQYGFAVDRLQQLQGGTSPSPALELLDEPVVEPVSPGGLLLPNAPIARLGIVILVGLLIGIGLISVLDRIDNTIRTRDMAETEFGLPVLAEIPRVPWKLRKREPVVVAAAPREPAAAAFRLLQGAVLSASTERMNGYRSEIEPEATGHSVGSRRGRVILITSAHRAEGKTTVASNLAAAFGETERRAVAVCADFRRPALHIALGSAEKPGLLQLLERERPLDACIHRSKLVGVRAIPSGGTVENPAALLARPQAASVLQELRGIGDVILVDATSLLEENDAAQLLPEVDGVLVVARAGQSTAESARRTGDFLSRIRAPVLGVVLVGVRGPTMPVRGPGASPTVGLPRQPVG